MQVNVVEISKIEGKEIYIKFSTNYGIASGFWRGNLPVINQSYHVEFTIPKVLSWGKDIIENDYRDFKIWTEKNSVFFNVQMECWEEDKSTIVRLGGSLILLEAEGLPCSVGSFLRIQSKEILLYPYSL